MTAELWVNPELLVTIIPILACIGYTIVGSRNSLEHVVLLVSSPNLSPEVRRVNLTVQRTENGMAAVITPAD
jgi:hypothetical protein